MGSVVVLYSNLYLELRELALCYSEYRTGAIVKLLIETASRIYTQ